MFETAKAENFEKVGESENFLEEFPRADAVVVLGGKLRKVKNRILPDIESKMRALAAFELLRNGIVPNIVFTGGKMKFPEEGAREMPDVSIAEAMKKYLEPYLRKEKIEESRILVDDQSINTAENLQNALKILKAEGLNKFYLETNEYHLGRGRQIFENILEKETGFELMGAKAAEELLKLRSPHYKELVSHYEFPEALKKSPKAAITKGLKEFLRRLLIYCDPNDRAATFLANIVRERGRE
jgi:uncharacterized SAM-binding protein YcdF (DUF218 family)